MPVRNQVRLCARVPLAMEDKDASEQATDDTDDFVETAGAKALSTADAKTKLAAAKIKLVVAEPELADAEAKLAATDG
jgi:hypothetical protein